MKTAKSVKVGTFKLYTERSLLPIFDNSYKSSNTKNEFSDDTKDKISVVPHPTSKLRLFYYVEPLGETERERVLRQKRIELQSWNHEYWSRINTEFISVGSTTQVCSHQILKNFCLQEKAKFIENELKQDNADYSPAQSYEELAAFYKTFLDSHRSAHIKYNLYVSQ